MLRTRKIGDLGQWTEERQGSLLKSLSHLLNLQLFRVCTPRSLTSHPVRRLLSFWDGRMSGVMLNFGTVSGVHSPNPRCNRHHQNDVTFAYICPNLTFIYHDCILGRVAPDPRYTESLGRRFHQPNLPHLTLNVVDVMETDFKTKGIKQREERTVGPSWQRSRLGCTWDPTATLPYILGRS